MIKVLKKVVTALFFKREEKLPEIQIQAMKL